MIEWLNWTELSNPLKLKFLYSYVLIRISGLGSSHKNGGSQPITYGHVLNEVHLGRYFDLPASENLLEMLIPGPQSKPTETEIWCSYAGKWNLKSEMLAVGSRQPGFLEVLQKILMPVTVCVSLLWTQRQKLMKRNLWRETKKERGRELPGDEHFLGSSTGKSLSFSFPLNRYLLRIQLVPLGTEQSVASSPGEKTLCFFLCA